MIDRLEHEAERMATVLGLKNLADSLQQAQDKAEDHDGGPVRRASARMAVVQAIMTGLLEDIMVLQDEAK